MSFVTNLLEDLLILCGEDFSVVHPDPVSVAFMTSRSRSGIRFFRIRIQHIFLESLVTSFLVENTVILRQFTQIFFCVFVPVQKINYFSFWCNVWLKKGETIPPSFSGHRGKHPYPNDRKFYPASRVEDSDPQYSHVFGLSGSGSISQRKERIRILPFSHKDFERTMLAKLNFLRLKIKKYEIFFWHP